MQRVFVLGTGGACVAAAAHGRSPIDRTATLDPEVRSRLGLAVGQPLGRLHPWGLRHSTLACNVSVCESTTAAPACVVEPVLGAEFPVKVEVVTGEWTMPVSHDFVAAAPRCMQDLCWFPPARAYSLGLYIAPTPAIPTDEKPLDADASPLLFDPSVDKTFRYAFVSKSDPAHILNGFERSLSTALPAREDYECSFERGLRDLEEFKRVIRKIKFQRGSVMMVTCTSSPAPEGRVIVAFAEDGKDFKVMGQVQSVALRYAFHNLYLYNVMTPKPTPSTAKYPSIAAKFHEACLSAAPSSEVS